MAEDGHRGRETVSGMSQLSDGTRRSSTRANDKVTAKGRSKPTGPWQDCAADLLGPIPVGGESLLLMVDYYSRFYAVAILKSTTSDKRIEAMTPMFARFGVAFSLKTDNGPQLVPSESEQYLEELGIEHRKSPPLWP